MLFFVITFVLNIQSYYILVTNEPHGAKKIDFGGNSKPIYENDVRLLSGEGRLRFGIANKKNGFLFGTPLNLHYRCLAAKVGCVSGLQTKKMAFLFGTPLNLHYLGTDF